MNQLTLSKIEDILLDFARLAQHCGTSNSDLQGVASVEAKKIIDLINKA